jgi:hypothetical protein
MICVPRARPALTYAIVRVLASNLRGLALMMQCAASGSLPSPAETTARRRSFAPRACIGSIRPRCGPGSPRRLTRPTGQWRALAGRSVRARIACAHGARTGARPPPMAAPRSTGRSPLCHSQAHSAGCAGAMRTPISYVRHEPGDDAEDANAGNSVTAQRSAALLKRGSEWTARCSAGSKVETLIRDRTPADAPRFRAATDLRTYASERLWPGCCAKGRNTVGDALQRPSWRRHRPLCRHVASRGKC